ncbi:MAG: alpha-glucan family phosphorylase [Candidatus Eisenbacteria bacterium]
MKERTIAYFSMEIALEPGMPTYSGGLGVLAGDTIRSAADLNVPMVAVTLLHRKGFFYQSLDPDGTQREEPADWPVNDFVREVPGRPTVIIQGRTVQVRVWEYVVAGVRGEGTVPVYLLDTDLPENDAYDRALTDTLYGGDKKYRLCQEAVLGIGGVRALRALHHDGIERFHMNEGHAALLTLELLREEATRNGRSDILAADVEAVRRKCVFTTHTPVPAGHDHFPIDLVREVLATRGEIDSLREVIWLDVATHMKSFRERSLDTGKLVEEDAEFNMTYLALNLSHYVNGVAKRHGEISRMMFADYPIDSITNGVHLGTWASPPIAELFDRHVPDWRQDNFGLRYALGIPGEELWEAHVRAKRDLLLVVNRETNAGLDQGVLTIGFARRAAAYKRADLLFTDTDRLRRIAREKGGLQIVYGGKAHPKDDGGKEMIRRIFRAKEEIREEIKLVYLANYDMETARLMVAGVDLWLNTPQPPNEASGTSGMKAALNGVPSLSVPDGWWVEGCIEGVTGWSIGDGRPAPGDSGGDGARLYEKLENVVCPLFYGNRSGFVEVMRHCIGLNAAFFNTHRMVLQYVTRAYFA